MIRTWLRQWLGIEEHERRSFELFRIQTAVSELHRRRLDQHMRAVQALVSVHVGELPRLTEQQIREAGFELLPF